MQTLQQGLIPSTLLITGSELRMSPELLITAKPGEVFVVRNLGGFVPSPEDNLALSFMASIEHAVSDLEVENIIILGSRYSSAIRMLMDMDLENEEFFDPVNEWLSIGQPVKAKVNESMEEASYEDKEIEIEKQVILQSIKHLLQYEWVKQRVRSNSLKIYGWIFDITNGELKGYNAGTKDFEPIA